MVGPRGLRVLADLGLPLPEGPDVGDMLIVGPTGRRVRLPSAEGLTYPGHGTAMTRTAFDAMLHDAALAAGVIPVTARAEEPLESAGHIDGYRMDTGEELRADFVIGADGATSGVASAAGLVDPAKVLWGFAVRTYLPQTVDLAAIVTWERRPWQAFPGYGWVFPGADGGANVGLGVATRADRRAGAAAVRALSPFLGHLHTIGLLDSPPPPELPPRLGGWLKMGMVGTRPASGRVLLVGDAAGLINPLQGEGIAQAMRSGQLAAQALLAGTGHAAERYVKAITAEHLPYQRVAAAAQAALAGHPRAIAVLARLLTLATWSDSFAGGWAVFWNELLEGAPRGRHRSVAAAMTQFGDAVTSRTAAARWFEALPLPGGPGP